MQALLNASAPRSTALKATRHEACQPTSIERFNLAMRMHNRRFTRLINAFSKKFENHVHMVAIWVVCYNWIRIHKTLRVTPAMGAGLTDRPWRFEELVAAMNKNAPKAGQPKVYKKRGEEISK